LPVSTATLIRRVRSGEPGAREQLIARILPLLNRWAHGRLPSSARGLMDTGDLVQVTLVRAMDRLDQLDSQREGALMAYLRRALLNQLRNEIRRSGRERNREALENGGFERFSDDRPSPLEQMVDRDVLDAYETGLATLPKTSQEAIILSVEFGYSHKELAEAIGSPSPNAARMAVSRALLKLAKAMEQASMR
jgi:RNA polymerase sigma factor (sigma-70 family)